MKPVIASLSAALLMAGCATNQPDYSDVGHLSRHASAMQWSAMTARAEQAVHQWLKANQGEEQFSSRRYYSFWKMSPGRDQRYLILVTGLKPARGNYWSADFIVIHGDRSVSPIIYHFANGTDRYIGEITPKDDGILVDYHQRKGREEHAYERGRSIFLFNGDTLQEVVLGPTEEWESTTMFQAMHRGPFTADDEGNYEAQPGDTITGIAREFKLRIEQLAILNPDVQWEELVAGQKIRVRVNARR